MARTITGTSSPWRVMSMTSSRNSGPSKVSRTTTSGSSMRPTWMSCSATALRLLGRGYGVDRLHVVGERVDRDALALPMDPGVHCPALLPRRGGGGGDHDHHGALLPDDL